MKNTHNRPLEIHLSSYLRFFYALSKALRLRKSVRIYNLVAYLNVSRLSRNKLRLIKIQQKLLMLNFKEINQRNIQVKLPFMSYKISNYLI